jgi:hypothetical protein
MAVNLYFIGTAGSGKTTLTGGFKTWMDQHGFDAITINLDPGVDALPYTPDMDIREWISLPEVMERYGIGPNGAQVVCADLLAFKVGEIRDIMDGYDVDYFLIDTPGQMELFTMRESSRAVIDVLGAETSLLTFLFDPVISSRPVGFVSLLLHFASAWFRFYCPAVSVLSKVDLMEVKDLERTLKWSTSPDALFDALATEKATMDNQLGFELLKSLESLEIYRPLIPISAETFEGMDDLYNVAQQAFFGGEDLAPD